MVPVVFVVVVMGMLDFFLGGEMDVKGGKGGNNRGEG